MFVIEYFLPFIAILTVLVFVHEWGHFWVARRNGVKVTNFSIGFGPELFGVTDKLGTRWSFSLIPMGGYVKMLGDSDASSARSDTSHLSEEEKKLTLSSKTPLQRIAVASAGPAANFIFAIIALAALITFKGLPFIGPTIGEVVEGQKAFVADLKAGDTIIKVGEKEVHDFNDIRHFVREYSGQDLPLTVKRGEDLLEKTIPMYDLLENGEKKPVTRLGIAPSAPVYERQNPFYALWHAVYVTYDLSVETLRGISLMVTGQKSGGELGGLLAIGDMASQSAKNGLATIIWFMAILSINLGLLNLFPIPVLDGGHIVMCAIEGVRGRPISEKNQERIFLVGFILILMLMVYATWNDFVRYGVVSFFGGLINKVGSLF